MRWAGNGKLDCQQMVWLELQGERDFRLKLGSCKGQETNDSGDAALVKTRGGKGELGGQSHRAFLCGVTDKDMQ